VYGVHTINQSIQQESLEKQVESALWHAQEAIDSQKREALAFSLFLSRSPSIKEAYARHDREAVQRALEAYFDEAAMAGNYHAMEVQFHTQTLHAWVRSWDKDSYGMPLSEFRKGLVHVKESLKPHVSIELGKRLNIKAIAPILLEGKFAGSVEVIVGFDTLSEQLMEKGIELMVLLDKAYLEIAEWESSKHRIGDFVLISDTCPCEVTLEEFAHARAFSQGFLEDKQRVYGFLPLFNVDATPLGFFGVALNKYELNKGNFALVRSSGTGVLPVAPLLEQSLPKVKIQ